MGPSAWCTPHPIPGDQEEIVNWEGYPVLSLKTPPKAPHLLLHSTQVQGGPTNRRRLSWRPRVKELSATRWCFSTGKKTGTSKRDVGVHFLGIQRVRGKKKIYQKMFPVQSSEGKKKKALDFFFFQTKFCNMRKSLTRRVF